MALPIFRFQDPGAVAAITALSRDGSNYLSVEADLSSATWNTAASHEVFTVTGLVRIRVLIQCTETLTDAADGASIQFGVEGATDAWIATTGAAGAGGDTIAAGEVWIDATPADTHIDTSSVFDKIVSGLDIGYQITGAALQNGTLVFHAWWLPISADGLVVAGAGGAL